MRLFVVCVTSVLSLSACENGPSELEDDARFERRGVQIDRVPGAISLTNGTERSIAYAVWNADWLARFAPCLDLSPGCLRLAPGTTVLVEDEDIEGYAPGATGAIVRWWHVVPDGAGGFRADELHELLVLLVGSGSD